MQKIFFSYFFITLSVAIPIKGWGAILSQSHNEIKRLIHHIENSPSLEPYKKESLIETLKAPKTEKQTKYVIHHIRGILKEPKSFQHRDELFRLFEDLDKEEYGVSGKIQNDILDALVDLCEIPVSGPGPQGHWLSLVLRYVSSEEDLRWKVEQIKSLVDARVDTLWDLKKSLYALLRLDHDTVHALISQVHTLIEKTHLNGKPVSRLAVLQSFHLVSKYFADKEKFKKHVLGIADRFNKYKKEASLPEDDQTMLLGSIEDGPDAIGKVVNS